MECLIQHPGNQMMICRAGGREQMTRREVTNGGNDNKKKERRKQGTVVQGTVVQLNRKHDKVHIHY